MTDAALAEALRAWADATLPALVGTHDHKPPRHTQGMPEVGVGIEQRSLTDTVPGLPRAMQQTMWDARTCELVVAVKPEPAKAQIAVLRGFVDGLLSSVRKDRTLGGRVEVVAPSVTVDYDPGEIVFEDETPARGFTLRLTVAETIPAP